MASLIGRDKDLEIKHFIRQCVNNNDMPDDELIRTIIIKYKLNPVGAKATAKPKKSKVSCLDVQVGITNTLSPRNSKGLITTNMSWAMRHVENIMKIPGTGTQRTRKFQKIIDEFIASHPDIDDTKEMTVKFLAKYGIVKAVGPTKYQLTKKWYQEIK